MGFFENRRIKKEIERLQTEKIIRMLRINELEEKRDKRGQELKNGAKPKNVYNQEVDFGFDSTIVLAGGEIMSLRSEIRDIDEQIRNLQSQMS